MKLHHLRLTGIGPFAGTVEIDLAALGAGGMFLLEGAAQLGERARDGRCDASDLRRGAGGTELDHEHGFAVVALGEGEGEG